MPQNGKPVKDVKTKSGAGVSKEEGGGPRKRRCIYVTGEEEQHVLILF